MNTARDGFPKAFNGRSLGAQLMLVLILINITSNNEYKYSFNIHITLGGVTKLLTAYGDCKKARQGARRKLLRIHRLLDANNSLDVILPEERRIVGTIRHPRIGNFRRTALIASCWRLLVCIRRCRQTDEQAGLDGKCWCLTQEHFSRHMGPCDCRPKLIRK